MLESEKIWTTRELIFPANGRSGVDIDATGLRSLWQLRGEVDERHRREAQRAQKAPRLLQLSNVLWLSVR